MKEMSSVILISHTQYIYMITMVDITMLDSRL